MNIFNEMEKRGIKPYELYEDPEEWKYYEDLYNCIGFHNYEKSKIMQLKILAQNLIDTYRLVEYAKEHGETKFLEKLRETIA